MSTKLMHKEAAVKTAFQREMKKRTVFFLKLAFFISIVYIQIQYPQITEDYGISSNIIDAVLFYITAHMIIAFSRLILVYFYIRKSGRAIDYKDNFILGINQIATILSFLMLVVSLFLLFNIDARDFFTSISIVAAAIALVSKDYISNMINGMIIMFSDQISLEDYVKIGDHRGKVTNITLLNMHIINDDDDLVYVPNNYLLTSDIVNFTKRNIKKITIEFELNQAHVKHYAHLKEDFKKVIEPYLKNIKDDTSTLKIVKINKDAIVMKFQFQLLKRNRLMEKEIRKKVHESIINILSKKDVEAL